MANNAEYLQSILSNVSELRQMMDQRPALREMEWVNSELASIDDSLDDLLATVQEEDEPEEKEDKD